MNFDKITNVLGIFTPIMIVMIFIITGYSFIGKSHDWTTLEAIATQSNQPQAMYGFLSLIIILYVL